MGTNALISELLSEYGRGVRVPSEQETRSRVEHGHFTAQWSECLSEFTADGASADDNEMCGKLRQIEDVFVRAKGDVSETGDRGSLGAGTGGDHCTTETQHIFVHRDSIRADEFPLAEEDMNAKFGESRRCVVFGNLRPQLVDSVHGRMKVDFGGSSDDAEL